MNDLVIGLIVIGFILVAVGIGVPIFAWWMDNKAEDWVQTVQKFFHLKPKLARTGEDRWLDSDAENGDTSGSVKPDLYCSNCGEPTTLGEARLSVARLRDTGNGVITRCQDIEAGKARQGSTRP